MPSKHLFFAAAACALPLTFAACGGSSDSSDVPPIPEGQHYGYVISKAQLPTTDMTRTQFGFDLGSRTSSKQDGAVDNKLSLSLQTLSLALDVDAAVNQAINAGTILLLVDFQTKDLANSSAAGFGVKIGAMPNPMPCTNVNDPTTCGQHLKGTGSFTLADNSPTDAVVGGKIISGAFTGGPGDVTLQLSVGGATPITLNLLNARVRATISATGIMDADIGGLITQTEIDTAIVPAILAQANAALASCTSSGGKCTCPGGGAAGFLSGLDANGDCQISADEIHSFTGTSLAPDICTTNSCTTPDGLSAGVRVQAVKAMFPGVM